MKRNIVKIIFAILVFVSSIGFLAAQPLPGPGEDGDPISPAPIGNGWVLLLGMASAYGASKVYITNRKKRP